MLAKNL